MVLPFRHNAIHPKLFIFKNSITNLYSMRTVAVISLYNERTCHLNCAYETKIRLSLNFNQLL